jgi:hypothetical protein
VKGSTSCGASSCHNSSLCHCCTVAALAVQPAQICVPSSTPHLFLTGPCHLTHHSSGSPPGVHNAIPPSASGAAVMATHAQHFSCSCDGHPRPALQLQLCWPHTRSTSAAAVMATHGQHFSCICDGHTQTHSTSAAAVPLLHMPFACPNVCKAASTSQSDYLNSWWPGPSPPHH